MFLISRNFFLEIFYRRTSSTEIHEATGLDMSLAQAFVAFLQTESTPKTPMKLPLKGDEELNSTNSTPNR